MATAGALQQDYRLNIDKAPPPAITKFAGEVIGTEYSLESDGSPSFEFEIKPKDGKEMEVDAITGKLAEDPEEEIYQIGEEK